MDDLVTLGKVAAVFAAVVWALKKRAPAGLALIAGGAAIALIMGRSPEWIWTQTAGAGLHSLLFDPATARFVGVMGMVVALTFLLERTGQIRRLTDALATCFRSPRLTLATLPSIIGLLPMPGGALFSAPMVEDGARGQPLDNEDKALVNYWYRHVWECVCPIYGAVILSAQLMQREVRTVSMRLFPLTLVALAAGWWFLAKADRPGPERNGSRRRAALDAALLLMPFLLIFTLYLGAGVSLTVAVGVVLLLTAAYQLARRRMTPGQLGRTLFVNPGILDMMLLGFGAMVFSGLMTRAGAIDAITRLFQTMGFPLVLLAVLLPMTVAFFSGMTIVHVATTFPILLKFPGVAEHPLPVIALAFAAGWCGMLLSPLHSCYVVSMRYFRVESFRPLYRLLVPCGALLASGAALMLALERLA